MGANLVSFIFLVAKLLFNWINMCICRSTQHQTIIKKNNLSSRKILRKIWIDLRRQITALKNLQIWKVAQSISADFLFWSQLYPIYVMQLLQVLTSKLEFSRNSSRCALNLATLQPLSALNFWFAKVGETKNINIFLNQWC